MPRSFCPNFDIRCRTCGETAIVLVRDNDAPILRLACVSCHTSEVLATNWPETFAPQPVPPSPPCMRHPGGWCPVATSGYCAVYCQAPDPTLAAGAVP